MPPAFATADELIEHRHNGHGCLAAEGSRLYVASNGDVYPCLTLMDDPSRRVATSAGGRMLKMLSPLPSGDTLHDFCHFIKMQTDGLYPLCIFYKDHLNAEGGANRLRRGYGGQEARYDI